MKRLLLFSVLIALVLPVSVRAQINSEVPQWVLLSYRMQIAKKLNQEFGAHFHFLQDSPDNPDAFFIDAVGDGGSYRAYVEMTQLTQPTPWAWEPSLLFKVDGYGVGNGQFFWLFGYFTPNGLKLKVFKESDNF